MSIDAFRAFEIPTALCDEFGYPELTSERKAKILGLNAARVYGIDPEAARRRAGLGDPAWVRAALRAYAASGNPGR